MYLSVSQDWISNLLKALTLTTELLFLPKHRIRFKICYWNWWMLCSFDTHSFKKNILIIVIQSASSKITTKKILNANIMLPKQISFICSSVKLAQVSTGLPSKTQAQCVRRTGSSKISEKNAQPIMSAHLQRFKVIYKYYCEPCVFPKTGLWSDQINLIWFTLIVSLSIKRLMWFFFDAEERFWTKIGYKNNPFWSNTK